MEDHRTNRTNRTNHTYQYRDLCEAEAATAITSRTSMLGLRLIERIRVTLSDPYGRAALHSAAMLLSVGLWFLHPNWMAQRFPRVAAEMGSVEIWGIMMVLLACTMSVVALRGSVNLIAVCYLCAFGLWLGIAWIFIAGTHPPPPIAAFALPQSVFSILDACSLPRLGRYRSQSSGSTTSSRCA